MTKEETIIAIRNQCIDLGLDLVDQIAYVLATVEHETAGTFQPVKEAYWKDEAWRQAHLRYYPYYGRGYVQLTWKANYQVYGRKLGLDLVAHPDLAMDPGNARFILIDGFKTGVFTGKKIADYINENDTDFINARRCINGLDCAQKIAALAAKYQEQIGKEA
jgi:predicted chitinase